jgi:hypothetical protein
MSADKPPRKIALEERAMEGARLFSPSAARNRDAIRVVFLGYMPSQGTILEIGAGTGEHALHLAAALPDATWTPSDPDPASRASIAAWTAHAGLSNVEAPRAIDVAAANWQAQIPSPIEAVVSINMIHIAPFAAAEGLIRGAGAILRGGGKLFLYGPFARKGAHTAPSNAAFDESLRARDQRWGVRDLDLEIIPLAEKAGLSLETVVEMPANNLSVIFRR